MLPADLFAATGRALFGKHFEKPLAQALNTSIETVDDWSTGRGDPPPTSTWAKLYNMAFKRHMKLDTLRQALTKAREP